MLQQSVTDDVNGYYWAVEAGEDLPFESEIVLAASGSPEGSHCADSGAEANPRDPEGLWTWRYKTTENKFECRVRWEGSNGFVEEYFDE